MRNAKAIWLAGSVLTIIAGLLTDITPASAQKTTTTAGVSRNPLGPSAQSVRQEWGKPWSADSSLVHTGVDIAAKKGSVARATSAGIVFQSGWLGCKDRTTNCSPDDPSKSWGYYVVVRQDNGRAQGYLHVTKAIPAGTPIKAGEKVGKVFENHLHYNECRTAGLCYRGAATPAEFNQGRYLKPNI
jgi:murein DD-endopeptidase MepM/ murein hydrolase activator NlpD